MIVDLEDGDVLKAYRLLSSAVTPRPIALVSTLSGAGISNLSPFSYFNAIGANPPVVGFSVTTPPRPGVKDTLANLREIDECVIHICSSAMVEAVNISSAEFRPEIDEFERANLPSSPSDRVRPKRISTAPVALEARCLDLRSYGLGPGAGTLAVCQILVAHIDDTLLTDAGDVDPTRLRPLARLGEDWYAEITIGSLFRVPRPRGQPLGLARVRELTGGLALSESQLAVLAYARSTPTSDDVRARASMRRGRHDRLEHIAALLADRRADDALAEAFVLLHAPDESNQQ